MKLVGGAGCGGLAKEGPLSAPARERTITLITHKHFFPSPLKSVVGGDIVLLAADERPRWPLPEAAAAESLK